MEKGTAFVGVHVTEIFKKATIQLSSSGRIIGSWSADLTPAHSLTRKVNLPKKVQLMNLKLVLLTQDGREVLTYQPIKSKQPTLPEAATEPSAPQEISLLDEICLIGSHPDQYRQATRSPEPYWSEALRHDPGDVPCNNALGLWHLRRGEFVRVEERFQRAIIRLTERNPNPYDGEPCYNLGLTLRHLGRDDDAYSAFYKATWNQAWQAAGFHALAEIDCCCRDWTAALDHLDRSLRLNSDHLRARDLRAIVLRKLGRDDEATLRGSSWTMFHPRGNPLGSPRNGCPICQVSTHLDRRLQVSDQLPVKAWGVFSTRA